MTQGWKIKKLSEIGRVFNGNSINENVKRDKYTDLDEGFPFIATKDIGFDSSIDYGNGIKITFAEKNKFKIAPSNTPLICAEGGSAGKKIGFTSQDVCFGNKLFAVVPNKNIDGKFIFYYYFSQSFQKNFSIGMTGMIGGVSMSKFKDIKIPIPSFPVQKRIVAILDEAFFAIAKAKFNAEQNLKNAKELFESYLQSVFENKDEAWEEKTLGSICIKISDGVHQKPTYVSSGVPFIKINNLTDGPGISFKNVSYIAKKDHELYCKRTHPEKGDILITKDGTIGIVRIIETDIEFSIFVSVALIKPKERKITPFLRYVLESPLIQKQIKPKGTALKHLYLTDLRKFIIPIPPLKVQQAIVKKLDALLNETKKFEALYQAKITNLEELKKSVLQKAFSGAIIKAEITS